MTAQRIMQIFWAVVSLYGPWYVGRVLLPQPWMGSDSDHPWWAVPMFVTLAGWAATGLAAGSWAFAGIVCDKGEKIRP